MKILLTLLFTLLTSLNLSAQEECNLDKATVDTDVRDAIYSFIEVEFNNINFSWNLVPTNSKNNEGLGVTQWDAMLDRLLSNHLIKRPEYGSYRTNNYLISNTSGEDDNLTALRLHLRKALLQSCATLNL